MLPAFFHIGKLKKVVRLYVQRLHYNFRLDSMLFLVADKIIIAYLQCIQPAVIIIIFLKSPFRVKRGIYIYIIDPVPSVIILNNPVTITIP